MTTRRDSIGRCSSHRAARAMSDIVPGSVRSRIMAAVPRKDSAPELRVRRVLHRLGYRYRLHVRSLPGSPDIVLPKHRKIVFVHGCFWHRHGCSRTTTPRTREDFWRNKFAANKRRDRRAVQALRRQGWSVATVWECETSNELELTEHLRRLMDDRRSPSQTEAPRVV